VRTVLDRLAGARSAFLLAGMLVRRTANRERLRALLDASGLPFTTMFMGKSVLDEQHPNYIGMYDGALMNEEVRDFVESCDVVLEVGTLFTDFNTGAFTAKLDPAKTVVISHHRVRIEGKVYPSVEMGTSSRRWRSACRNIEHGKSCRSLRLARLSGKGLIPSPQRHSIRGGRTSFVRATFLWLRLGPPPWVWASHRCRQAQPSIIKRSGVRSAGQHPRHLERPWQLPIAGWCWSLVTDRTSLPRRRWANSGASGCNP